MADSLDDIPMDRTAFRVVSFGDDSSDIDYWLSRPPAERIAAVEMLRKQYHGNYEQFQRVFRIVEFGES